MCAVCIKQSAGLQSSCDHTFGGQISNCRRHPKLSSLGSRALSRHLGQLRRTEAIDGIFSRCCWDLLRSRRRVARPTSSSPPRPTRRDASVTTASANGEPVRRCGCYRSATAAHQGGRVPRHHRHLRPPPTRAPPRGRRRGARRPPYLGSNGRIRPLRLPTPRPRKSRSQTKSFFTRIIFVWTAGGGLRAPPS